MEKMQGCVFFSCKGAYKYLTSHPEKRIAVKNTQNNACQKRGHGGTSLVLFFAFLVLALFSARAGATVILRDAFSDGSYTNQALPGSADWYIGGPTPNMSISPTAGLSFADASGQKATAMAYFTPTELAIGASLTLSFDYSFTQVANADNAFMFGLYNSGGSYLTKDSSLSFNSQVFNNYTGYATSGVFGADPSGSGRDHIEARNLPGKNLLSIGTYTEGQEYKQVGAATPGEIYTASMSIARTAAGLTVTSHIGNTTMTQTYTSAMFTKFDAVGIFSNGDSGSFTMDNIQLDYVGAPEPSVFYALALFGASIFGRASVRSARKVLGRFLPRLAVS